MFPERNADKEYGWLIWKDGRGWYRPEAAGYTLTPSDAGRYSWDDAWSHSHPNGLRGPRDGMSIHHECDVPGATPQPPAQEAQT